MRLCVRERERAREEKEGAREDRNREIERGDQKGEISQGERENEIYIIASRKKRERNGDLQSKYHID